MVETRIGGIVLCGGQSSRMGEPKAWLPIGGERMLPRIVRVLRDALDPVVVVAAPGQELPELPSEVMVVRDAVAGRGPLQGISAGLHALASLADAAYVSSCDVPFLTPSFVRAVADALGDADVAVPFVDERHHPLAAVYRTSLVPRVDALLAADRLRPFFLFESVRLRTLYEDDLRTIDAALASLRNVNTRGEYETVLNELGSVHEAQ